jgi:hypothetical protein
LGSSRDLILDVPVLDEVVNLNPQLHQCAEYQENGQLCN